MALTPGSDAPPPAPTLPGELAVLDRARGAARERLAKLAGLSGGGADEASDQFIDAVVASTMDRLRQELVVFGRIDDDHAWRIGLFGIDDGGERLVVDWRAPFAAAFYQAAADDPRGLVRRTSYVGCIDDLMIEDFLTGEVSGSSPLMAELSRHRGERMKAAVATLQSDQDRLVRRDPASRVVIRGGPGTGKTVVALHRAAWLVYNDRRITSDNILILGPSERFLRFVATVLPTLGEARITQTTLDRHLGPASEVGADESWVGILDRLEEDLVTPREVVVTPKALSARRRRLPAREVEELCALTMTRPLPWKDRRRTLVSLLARRLEVEAADASAALTDVVPVIGPTGVWTRIRSRRTLHRLGASTELIDAWLATPDDGPLRDEVAARFRGVDTRYSHVIVDEAQDLNLLQLRAVQRRSTGLTLVGDDAQRSAPGSLGLRRIAAEIDVEADVMAAAYRMSAEIADWLNALARRHHLDAVSLLGVRPTGIAVTHAPSVAEAEADLSRRWNSVAVIRSTDVWGHKGVEYDAVVVDAAGMGPAQQYLAGSRAAHQLVVVP